jgi:hypothetical protein
MKLNIIIPSVAVKDPYDPSIIARFLKFAANLFDIIGAMYLLIQK